MYTNDENVTLENLCGGEVGKRFEQLLEEAIKNCLDLNYDGSPRKVSLILEIKPNDRRDEVTAVPKFKCDKGRIVMAGIPMAIGIGPDGRAVAKEFVSRQQALFNQGVTPIRPIFESEGGKS